MNMRRDSGQLAEQLTAKLRALPGEIDGLRLTIGSMRWHPNLVNVIPDRVTFTVDARHPSPEKLSEVEKQIENILHSGADNGFTLNWRSLARVAPCTFASRVVDAVASAVFRNGLTGHRMISGAGHDAHILSRCYDAGMVFIPSKDGISHHPDEYSTDAQILSGTQVLLDTILTLVDHPFTS